MTLNRRARDNAMESSCFPNSASDFYDTVLKCIMKGLVSKNLMKKKNAFKVCCFQVLLRENK